MASIVKTKGVDISEFNGDISLKKVKDAGYKWVMIRCGYGQDMTSQDDEFFATNVAKAEALGMPWGVYLFSYACSAEQAKGELEHIDRLLKQEAKKGHYPTLPIALDIEPTDYVQNKGGWTKSNLTTVATAVLDGLKKLGYYPMIYTGYEELDYYLSDHIRNDYDCWFAQWYKEPNLYKYNKMGMWQYGGEENCIDTPYISGVDGKIDKDIVYKDYPSMIKKKTSTTTPTPTTTVKKETGITAQKVIDTAYSLLYKDEHRSCCDIMYWYKGFDTTINEVACCCAGQMYLFYKAGAFDLIPGGKVADCGSLCKNFYNAKQLYGPNEVKPGDLVIFSWEGVTSSYWPASELGYKTLEHVELCVAVNKDGTITCIGANNGGTECDDFQLKTRYKSNISCCCRPKYGTSSSSSSSSSSSNNSSKTSSNSGSSSIKTVQKWVNANYKTNLNVDGIYGPATKKALVKALQTELNKQTGAGLQVDGIYGPATNNAIVIIDYGCQGNITRILQGLLICNGYSTNGFDGLFGNGTKSAIQSFQGKKGLSKDGIAGKATFSALCK